VRIWNTRILEQCRWECEFEQPLWKAVVRMRMNRLFHLAIVLLDKYAREILFIYPAGQFSSLIL
jgi:hypothetical protein